MDEPVVVEFYSKVCSNCEVFNPIVDSISYMMGDQAKFVRLDVHSSEGNLRLAMGRASGAS